MDAPKEYHEVIELEAIDDIVAGPNHPVAAAILLLFLERSKLIDKLRETYSFDVIAYGFMGYFPAIGVHFENSSCKPVGDMLIIDFNIFARQLSLSELLEGMATHKVAIAAICADIRKSN